MKKTWFALLAALTLTFCLSGISFGQETTGSLTGTVKDANGAGVPGATVTIADASKRFIDRPGMSQVTVAMPSPSMSRRKLA